jgi:RHS repeat-associated protein
VLLLALLYIQLRYIMGIRICGVAAERTDFGHRHPVMASLLFPIVILFSGTFGCSNPADGPGFLSGLFTTQGSYPGSYYNGDGLLVGGPRALLSGDTTMGLPVGTYFYHSDHLGSSSVVTDATGAVTTRIHYLPYGQVDHPNSPGLDSVTYKFTGQEYDPEAGTDPNSGLYNYGARFFDPKLGIFISADTVHGGGLSQGMNRWMYVGGNPINYVDPSGHTWIEQVTRLWADVGRHLRLSEGERSGIKGGVAWANNSVRGGVTWGSRGVVGALSYNLNAADEGARHRAEQVYWHAAMGDLESAYNQAQNAVRQTCEAFVSYMHEYAADSVIRIMLASAMGTEALTDAIKGAAVGAELLLKDFSSLMTSGRAYQDPRQSLAMKTERIIGGIVRGVATALIGAVVGAVVGCLGTIAAGCIPGAVAGAVEGIHYGAVIATAAAGAYALETGAGRQMVGKFGNYIDKQLGISRKTAYQTASMLVSSIAGGAFSFGMAATFKNADQLQSVVGSDDAGATLGNGQPLTSFVRVMGFENTGIIHDAFLNAVKSYNEQAGSGNSSLSFRSALVIGPSEFMSRRWVFGL